jgi:putative salt-induced outer membrane protein
MKLSSSLAAVLAVLGAGSAHAALPDNLRSMVTDALASGSDAEIDAVAKFVKRSSPGDAAEVDALVADHQAKLAAADEEKKRNAGFLDNWSGQGQLGGFQSSGNSKTTGYSAGLSLKKEGLNWRHNLRVLADYQRSNGVTDRNNLLAAYEPNYKFNDRLFAFGLAQYERDRFQGFDSRFTASAGLGYRVIEASTMTLDVKAGPAWRKTNYRLIPSESSIAGFGSLDYAWKISPSLTFTEVASVLADSDNTTFLSLTALDAKVSSALSARISYQFNHNTTPPLGIKKTDTLTRFTLVYGF